MKNEVKKMPSILDLNENTLYAEDERWICHLENDTCINLGIVFEAVDTSESAPGETSYSIVTEAQIIPQPEYLGQDILQQIGSAQSREKLILDVYTGYGGVPLNIDVVLPAGASCGASSFLADAMLMSRKSKTGEEIEMRHFRDVENALKFAREYYIISAQVVFDFIDQILDQPINSRGETGWDKIRELASHAN